MSGGTTFVAYTLYFIAWWNIFAVVKSIWMEPREQKKQSMVWVCLATLGITLIYLLY